MKPVVSVVIPLYNKEMYIGRSVGSVLSQTFQEFEIVVVDDGSSDDGPRLVERIRDPRIRIVRQENSGVSVARNRGTDEAVASLIAFLDADDEYKPDFLSWCLERLHEKPELGAVAFNYEVARAGEPRRSAIVSSENSMLLGIDQYCRLARQGSAIFSSSVMVKKELLQGIGGFPKGVKAGEDIDTWLRIIGASRVFFDSRVAAVYHCEGDRHASSRNHPGRVPYFFETLDCVVKKTPGLTSSALRDVDEFKNIFILSHAIRQIRFFSAADGRNALLACRTRVYRRKKWKWVAISLLPLWLSSRLRRLKNRMYASGSWHVNQSPRVSRAKSPNPAGNEVSNLPSGEGRG